MMAVQGDHPGTASHWAAQVEMKVAEAVAVFDSDSDDESRGTTCSAVIPPLPPSARGVKRNWSVASDLSEVCSFEEVHLGRGKDAAAEDCFAGGLHAEGWGREDVDAKRPCLLQGGAGGMLAAAIGQGYPCADLALPAQWANLALLGAGCVTGSPLVGKSPFRPVALRACDLSDGEDKWARRRCRHWLHALNVSIGARAAVSGLALHLWGRASRTLDVGGWEAAGVEELEGLDALNGLHDGWRVAADVVLAAVVWIAIKLEDRSDDRLESCCVVSIRMGVMPRALLSMERAVLGLLDWKLLDGWFGEGKEGCY